jgi:hypothetical protein
MSKEEVDRRFKGATEALKLIYVLAANGIGRDELFQAIPFLVAAHYYVAGPKAYEELMREIDEIREFMKRAS